MSAGRLTISAILACAFLGGCGSTETRAPAAAVAQAPSSSSSSGPNKALLEDNPAKLAALSCETLDDTMASNYGVACLYDTSTNAFDKAVAAQSADKFKAQQKEYKSRCKGAQVKLAEMKRSRGNRKCALLPNA